MRRSPCRWLLGFLVLAPLSCDRRTTPASGEPAPRTQLRATILTGPDIQQNSNPAVPLAAVVKLTTDTPTQVEFTLFDGQLTWTVLAQAEYGTDHRVPVLGMRPNRTHMIGVTVIDTLGNRTTAPNPLSFTTPALPPNWPPIQVTRSRPALMEPGVTMFSVRAPGPKYMVMLDAAGEVVWYYDGAALPSRAIGGDRMPNGNILIRAGRLMVEIDLLGNQLGAWYASGLTPASPMPGAIAVATDRFHHDAIPLGPNDAADFVVISSELRVLNNYPTSPVNVTQTAPTANVVGDVLVEFKSDGSIVREFKLLDILDPYRICWDTLQPFVNQAYGGQETEDWSHANAVVLDTRDNSYVVSVRNQEAVVKISRDTGQLVWILGDHARWISPWDSKLLMPIGGTLAWNYHQHAPEITGSGEVLMFDNGNYRVVPPLPSVPPKEEYSRAVQFRIDEAAMTVEQTWAYGGTASHLFYSPALGDADELPVTGNVLVTDGFKRTAGGPLWARIAEVTGGPAPKVVFEVIVRDPSQTAEYTVYRAQHLPSVYPH